jgi:hypothetical protein
MGVNYVVLFYGRFGHQRFPTFPENATLDERKEMMKKHYKETSLYVKLKDYIDEDSLEERSNKPIYENGPKLLIDNIGSGMSGDEYLYFWRSESTVITLDDKLKTMMENVERDTAQYLDKYQFYCELAGLEYEKPKWHFAYVS